MVSVYKTAHSSALLAGAQLWVLPGSKDSQWTKKIDWYLNFQISRANQRQCESSSPTLLKILNDNPELKLTLHAPLDKKNTPLIVSSSSLLPNEQTLEVIYQGHPEKWVEQIHSIWNNLKRPSLRIFVPDQIDEDKLLKQWSTLDDGLSSTEYIISIVRN
ncbi:MAG: hypothetical protein KDD50_11530 [Bdellovibrionales bacterium]|nr:hypothetical protein [Bdellovibrionales bacterium]